MSFFHLKFSNAESIILNLDVRSSILIDYMFRKMVLEKCEDYLHSKAASVAHTTEETKANVVHLQSIIDQMNGSSTASTSTGNGEAVVAAAAISTTGLTDNTEDLQSKVKQLEEMLKTLDYQKEALEEAKTKISGAVMEEIDVCSDSGVPMGLNKAGSTSAADILDSRSNYTLCRQLDDKVIQLSFAVPPDDAVNLDMLLGPTRLKITKKEKNRGGKKHRRSSSTRPKGNLQKKKLADITNQKGGHRRAQTTAQ